MNVCIAFDSFKDCVTSRDLSFQLSHILSFRNDLKCTVLPIADGGEGSLAAIQESHALNKIELSVLDPLKNPIEGYYLINELKNEAFIELAVVSGIERVDIADRNCWNTTAYGTGQLINHAIKQKVQKIHLFLGSSSTTEMGVSIAAACGWKFYIDGEPLKYPTGKDLIHIDTIEPPDMSCWPEMIACADVNNPLYGDKGAACVYGPQKGASIEQIDKLDKALKHMASLMMDQFGMDLQNVPGAGAAGGIGAGTHAFFNAKIIPGFEVISEALDLEENIKNADVVISGEGSFDELSFNGKGVHRILQIANKYGKRSIIICGRCELSERTLHKIKDCTIYDLSAIFKHQEISKKKTFEQLEQLKEQIITSITS